MSALKIITTADGSHSLLNESMQEPYHTIHGAIQESMHVFIECGLQFYLASHKIASLKLFEVGFGTGLNAWLTLKHAQDGDCIVEYSSIEAFPLDEEIWASLNYAGSIRANEFFKLHQLPWNKQKVNAHFILNKIHARLEDAELEEAAYDVVYFDAFAPSKQPELWSLQILQKIERAMKPGGVFVTYCAKGQLKRDLRSLQLIVETLPGPPGKKEMIRATKI